MSDLPSTQENIKPLQVSDQTPPNEPSAPVETSQNEVPPNEASGVVNTESSAIYDKTEFDDLLKRLGGFSRFQHIQWLLLFLTTIPQAWDTYAPAFSAAYPRPHEVYCADDPSLTGEKLCTAWYNGTCDDVEYNTRYSSIVTDWDMICDDIKSKVPLTKAIFAAGKLVGAYFFGWVSDRFGRRFTLLVTMLVMFVATLIQAFSVDFTMFVILRVPLGICSGGNFIAAFTLMTEMVTPEWRRWANTLVQSGYGVGIATEALLAYLIPKWKPFTLTIALLNVPFVLYYWYVPESPRWLAARGRTQEAEKVVREIARMNGREYPPEALSILKSKSEDREKKKTYHIWDLFSTRYLAKITVIEAWAWCVTTMVYYGLSFNSGNLAGDFYINFALSGLVEIPAYIMAGYLVEKVNRRIPACLYLVCGGVILLCIFPIQLAGKHEELAVLVTAFALVGKFLISASFYQVYIHTAELYPTVIRTIGVGFSSLCGRVGGTVAPYIADSTPLIAPALIFGATAVSAGLASLLLPETRGKPLQDFVHHTSRKEEEQEMEKRKKDGETAFVSTV